MGLYGKKKEEKRGLRGVGDHHLDSGIADAAFDAAQVSAVEVGSFGEFVLRKAAFVAEVSDVPAEGGKRFISFWH